MVQRSAGSARSAIASETFFGPNTKAGVGGDPASVAERRRGGGRYPAVGDDRCRGDRSQAADARGWRQLQGDEEPAGASRTQGHQVRESWRTLHRPHGYRLLGGSGGGG